MSDYVIGLLVTLLGLTGLLAAANALDHGMAVFGTALFLFAVFFDFWLVKKAFDQKS
jgi:hypothetical protein